MQRRSLNMRIVISGILAILLFIAGSTVPTYSFDPSSDGSLGCGYNNFPNARWAGDRLSYKIGALEGLPPTSDVAIRTAAFTWTNTRRSRAWFDEDTYYSNNVVQSDWIPFGRQGWTKVNLTSGVINKATTFLDRYYPWQSTTEVREVATHEFGHWLWLGDLYGSGCPPYWQNHTDALMYVPQWYPTWDEDFGAMSLYGPDYRGFEPDWGYWDQPDVDSVNCPYWPSGCQAHRVTPENGVPVVWDNAVPNRWSNKFLRVSGNPGGTGPEHAYMKLFDMNLLVEPGMRLRWHQYFYWQPWISIDARFADGTYLRDYHLPDQNGKSIHPAERPYYPGGQWLWFDVDLSSVVGKTIQTLMVGYDHGWGQGEYLGYIDNINIGVY